MWSLIVSRDEMPPPDVMHERPKTCCGSILTPKKRARRRMENPNIPGGTREQKIDPGGKPRTGGGRHSSSSRTIPLESDLLKCVHRSALGLRFSFGGRVRSSDYYVHDGGESQQMERDTDSERAHNKLLSTMSLKSRHLSSPKRFLSWYPDNLS